MTAQVGAPASRRYSRSRALTHAIVKDPLLSICCALLMLIVFSAIAASWIAPFDPDAQNLSNRLVPPFSSRPGVSFLGADPLGRDMLSRLIFGSRISLVVASLAVLLSGTFGLVLGIVAGLREGISGMVIMRIADTQFSVPTLVLALAIVAAIGPGIFNIIIVLGISGWVPYARVMRAEVLVIKEREFMQAARGLGASSRWLVWHHVLPNTVGVIAVIAAIQMAYMMITEASLSFLGLGVPPGTADWGAMISDGRNYLYLAWWVSALPGLAIVFTVVALNIVGDWLSDHANPALRTW